MNEQLFVNPEICILIAAEKSPEAPPSLSPSYVPSHVYLHVLYLKVNAVVQAYPSTAYAWQDH